MLPDVPPPSSSPPTRRDATDPTPTGATGGLDPYPPNPGARAIMLAPHGVLVAELAAVAALAHGSVMLLVLPALLVLAAWGAWLLARIDTRHGPIAIGLGAWAALALLGRTLDVTALAADGPYHGLLRVAFRIEEATRLATAALPAWMALTTLAKWPPGPTPFDASVSLGIGARAWIVRGPDVLLTFITFGLWAYLVAGYPELHDDALRRVYLGTELAALFVAVVAILSLARRASVLSREREAISDRLAKGWDDITANSGLENDADRAELPRWYTYGTVLALVVGDLALLIWGAWRWGLFGDAYVVQQSGLVAVWGTVAAIQVAALVLARRGR